MSLSLNTRLLAAATSILLLFFGVTGFVLDEAFQHSIVAAQKDRLQAHANALIAATELGFDGVARLTHALPETRFFTPGSELLGMFASNDGAQVWKSPSMDGIGISFSAKLARGEQRFSRIVGADGREFYVFNIGVTWGERQGPHGGYTFSIAEDASSVQQEILGFRRNLWGWLSAVAVLLLLVQGIVLRWGLAPLRHLADELLDIEYGRRTELAGTYPRELQALTNNLNALIRNNREHLKRYRNGLGDLAHSLKTPLALLQSAVERPAAGNESRQSAQTQIERMVQIIDYQLQRAATSGRKALVAPVDVLATARKVVDAMNKVYAGKSVICHIHIDDGIRFRGDQGDLMEVLGNTIDNAYKCCRQSVEVRGSAETGNGADEGIVLSIADDGPGIPADLADQVVLRGVRASSQTEGQGIGLAVVHDIVKIYGGYLEIGKSSLGGALVKVHLPRR